MANDVLSINIFNEHYELPKDITTYIEEHHCFECYRQELLAYFMENCYNFEKLPDNIEQKAYEKFRNYGDLCVQKLINNNIYNITVDELVGAIPEQYVLKFVRNVSTNDGVKLFYQALNDMMMERTNALLAQIDSFNDQAQQAEYERDSQITGTGIEIFTNDIISFGVWAAMESKEIKKQSSVANAQFNNKIDTIMQSLEDRTNTRLSQYESNVWLPQLKNSVDLFP